MADMISSVGDVSSTSQSPERDVEAAVGLKSGAVGQEKVIQTFLPAIVGFYYSEQRMQNRGKKGFQTSQSGRTHHQPFYPMQHRCSKLLSWPAMATLIGVLVALLVFGFYYPSTRHTASTASPLIQISHGQAEAAFHSRLDGEFQARLPRFVKNDYSRAARAVMVFGRKVLDTLQKIFWGIQHNKLTEAEVGETQGKPKIPLSNPVDLHNDDVVYRNVTHFKNNLGERRMLLQEEMSIMRGKYLRGFAEFGAELTKKKRLRKQRNEEAQARRDGDPQAMLLERLYPLVVADSVRENPLYFRTVCTDAPIAQFFYFCYEFPELRDLMAWAASLMFCLVYLRGTFGQRAWKFCFFLAVPVMLIWIVLYHCPWRLLDKVLRAFGFQRRKRS